jgi:hypothetical protein
VDGITSRAVLAVFPLWANDGTDFSRPASDFAFTVAKSLANEQIFGSANGDCPSELAARGSGDLAGGGGNCSNSSAFVASPDSWTLAPVPATPTLIPECASPYPGQGNDGTIAPRGNPLSDDGAPQQLSPLAAAALGGAVALLACTLVAAALLRTRVIVFGGGQRLFAVKKRSAEDWRGANLAVSGTENVLRR